MGVWDQIIAGIIEIGGTTGKDVLAATIRERILKPSLDAARFDSSHGDTPAGLDFCPFCSIAKSMAAANLYLTRASQKNELAPVYLQLASTAATDALATASVVSETPSTRQMVLIRSLTELDIRLSSPVKVSELSGLAAKALAIAHRALDLAEFSNIGELEAPKEIAAPQDNVIEGEFKVLEEKGTS